MLVSLGHNWTIIHKCFLHFPTCFSSSAGRATGVCVVGQSRGAAGSRAGGSGRKQSTSTWDEGIGVNSVI